LFVKRSDEGLTPVIPNDCPQKLRELMQMCWKMQPEQRPVSNVQYIFVLAMKNFKISSLYVSFIASLSAELWNDLCLAGAVTSALESTPRVNFPFFLSIYISIKIYFHKANNQIPLL